jgi:exonuclease SbcD
MKILHTSDWHLGHTLYGYDRQEEQQDMLQQILEITRKERPDAFLLSGDVYDIPQPSATSQKMFSEFMAKLHKAVPGMRIIVTAGNHDSGMRTEAF